MNNILHGSYFRDAHYRKTYSIKTFLFLNLVVFLSIHPSANLCVCVCLLMSWCVCGGLKTISNMDLHYQPCLSQDLLFVIVYTRLNRPWDSEQCPDFTSYLPIGSWGLKMCVYILHINSRNLNSGFYACLTSTLLTDPFLQPRKAYFAFEMFLLLGAQDSLLLNMVWAHLRLCLRKTL